VPPSDAVRPDDAGEPAPPEPRPEPPDRAAPGEPDAAAYDPFAPYYHLVYPDWAASVARQGAALDAIIREAAGGGGQRAPRTVLDAACGIGTQSLGLAARGYAVTASDLSPAAVARARREAAARGLAVACSVADMREAFAHHGRTFDVVLACDNSVPHLLTDADIRRAFDQFFLCTAPGGLCLVSARDYAAMPLGGTQVHGYGVRRDGETQYVLAQVWTFDEPGGPPPGDGGSRYTLSFYVVADDGRSPPAAHVLRARYYAVSLDRLRELMRDAGFADVRRLDGPYFQPVLLGRRPPAAGATG
jgi:SAM-dependent methyltransferase